MTTSSSKDSEEQISTTNTEQSADEQAATGQAAIEQATSVQAAGEKNTDETPVESAAPDSLAAETQTADTRQSKVKEKEKKKTESQKQTQRPPKRPQAVLFILAESPLLLADNSENPEPSALASLRLPRDEKLNEIRIAASHFGPKLSRFFTPVAERNAEPLSDASILLLPLRSMRGVFTWASSISQLRRFDQLLRDTTCAPRWPLAGLDEASVLSGPSNSCVQKDQLVLEEYSFPVKIEPRVQGISRWLAANALPQQNDFQWWRAKLARDLVLLPDAVYSALLEQRLQEYRTDSSGKAYLDEVVPRDALAYSLPHKSLAKSQLETAICQIGRDQDHGAGLCRLQYITRANNKARRKKKKGKAPESSLPTEARTEPRQAKQKESIPEPQTKELSA